MMKINWKVRVWSIKFWLTLIPAVTLLVQTVITPLGYHWDFGILNQQLAAIVNAVFGVLAIIGVVADPTTAGVSDSEQAQDYGALITTKSAQIAQLQLQVESLKKVQATATTQIASGVLNADKLNIPHLDASDIASGETTTDASKEATTDATTRA